MGLFSFSKPKRQPWTEVGSVDQLHALLQSSDEKPVLLFKHSTRCSISSMALHAFESKWQTENELCTLCFVDLIRFRDVSNEIAQVTQVQHQSPQAILVKGDTVMYHASHSGIDSREIEQILKKA
jgi:bacillithiol system protein YtxJ